MWCVHKYISGVQLHEQIAAAMRVAGWSVGDLLTRSGLKMHRSQLNRRLLGSVPMRTREAEILADTLRAYGVEVTLTWPSASPTTRRAA